MRLSKRDACAGSFKMLSLDEPALGVPELSILQYAEKDRGEGQQVGVENDASDVVSGLQQNCLG